MRGHVSTAAWACKSTTSLHVIIGTRLSPSLFLHGCKTKAGVGRTGNEARERARSYMRNGPTRSKDTASTVKRIGVVTSYVSFQSRLFSFIYDRTSSKDSGVRTLRSSERRMYLPAGETRGPAKRQLPAHTRC